MSANTYQDERRSKVLDSHMSGADRGLIVPSNDAQAVRDLTEMSVADIRELSEAIELEFARLDVYSQALAQLKKNIKVAVFGEKRAENHH